MLLSRQFKLTRVINVKRGFNSFDLVRIPGDLYVIRLKFPTHDATPNGDSHMPTYMKTTTAVLIALGVACAAWVGWNLAWFVHEPLLLVTAGLMPCGFLLLCTYAEYRSIRHRDCTATILCGFGWGLLGLVTLFQAISIGRLASGLTFLLPLVIAFFAFLLAASHVSWVREKPIAPSDKPVVSG